MNANISGADGIVAEYLIYRGFTQTFQSLELERVRDRTKRFEVVRIVESLFSSLHSFEIETFISLWDFLNKRFFFHLDSEHVKLAGLLKADMIKYYLVNSIRTKNKPKVVEFFSAYSHEILAEGGSYIPGNLRSWFVLPYLDEPEKDPEFAAYFEQRWADLLKYTLRNFLSVLLSSAPLPKILLLERWFRSDAQYEIRSQLKASAKKVDGLITRIQQYETRLQALRESVNVLSTLLYHSLVSGARPEGIRRSFGPGMPETEDEVEKKHTQGREFGLAVARIASDCLRKSSQVQNMPQEDKLLNLLGRQCFELVLENSVAAAAYGLADAEGEERGAIISLDGLESALDSPGDAVLDV
eukprot:CAMPEP_0173270776 /NCGR_PEP_ID=MMETSP1143-20121109/434_1 /TAXON_ID=483371 /ORGANISM="non described non described, Strain CCMP2298" /LENGTH=355 /DNA_ID=CAMNT_0014207237 /DNA_START=21 /DNA_END=1085 /DNA_ORIENTATION=+